MRPTDARAAKEIAQLISDLQWHQERLAVSALPHQGACIPSGAVGSNGPTSSSAMCASSVQGSGGTVTNARNQRLALRCAKDHGTLGRVACDTRQQIPRPFRIKAF